MSFGNFPKPTLVHTHTHTQKKKADVHMFLLYVPQTLSLSSAMASSRKRAASPPSRNEEVKSPLAILLLKLEISQQFWFRNWPVQPSSLAVMHRMSMH